MYKRQDPDRPDRLIYTGDDYRTRFGIDVSAYQNRASANNKMCIRDRV